MVISKLWFVVCNITLCWLKDFGEGGEVGGGGGNEIDWQKWEKQNARHLAKHVNLYFFSFFGQRSFYQTPLFITYNTKFFGQLSPNTACLELQSTQRSQNNYTSLCWFRVWNTVFFFFFFQSFNFWLVGFPRALSWDQFLIILYTQNLSDVISHHSVSHHMFVDIILHCTNLILLLKLSLWHTASDPAF